MGGPPRITHAAAGSPGAPHTGKHQSPALTDTLTETRPKVTGR
jgi:hypothetical protein